MTGGELRALREGAGLTQAEAASVLDVPASTYAKRERGESEIPDEMAGRAARVLGGLRGAVLPDEAATERANDAAKAVEDAVSGTLEPLFGAYIDQKIIPITNQELDTWWGGGDS